MTTEEIYFGMMSEYAGETGMEAFYAGDLAVRFHAVAAQVYSLYAQAEWVKTQCFPQSATGEYLDYHAQMRGLSRKSASHAEGIIRFSVSAPQAGDLVIEPGTVCMTGGMVRFETTEQGVLRAGNTAADVPARAAAPGSAGNAGAGSILYMAVAPMGISRCGNPSAFVGGTDDEGDEALRERIIETYRRMPNGANAAYYEQQAMTFDEVAAVSVVPRSRGIGTVDVVVSTPSGLPDQGLLQRIQAFFDQRREIAVDVAVRAPTLISVDLQVQVEVKKGYNADQVLAGVRETLSLYYDGFRLGEDVLKARLGTLIYSVSGVENYRILMPEDDVTIDSTILPRLGTLTVSEREAGQ